MPEWAVDGEAIEGERPILRRTFDDVGRHTVSVNLYRVRRSFGIHDKTLFRQASTTIEVQSPTEAGERLLQEMGREPAPRLSAVETSIQQSITEIEQQVARGGEQAAYWRRRLEAQRSRLEQLREHVPSLGTAQDLPSDPTALAAGMSYSGPIPAVLVMPSAGGAQPLSIYLTTRQEGNRWNARLVDITGADVWKFDGMGATPLEAYHDAFEDWMDDHPYPRGGRVVYRFSPPGWTLGSSFGTTTVWNTAKAWVDGLLTVGAVVVAGLLLAAPTAGVTQALGLILLAATVARSTVAIVENIDRGMEPLDSRNVLEGVAIVTSFVGVGGTALRQVGIRAISPVVYRTGSWLVLTSIAADAGTLVYATSEAIQQIRATQSDPTLDESQKQMAMLRLISVLLTQGLLFFVANRDMFRGGLRRSDFFATNPPATAAGAQRLPQGGPITLEPGSRLDVAAELRRAGDTPERLRTMTNDRELLDRYLTLPWLRPLPADQAADMLRRLSTSALTGLTDLTAQEARRIVNGLADDAVVNALAPELRGDRLRDLLGATTSEHVRGLHTAFGPQGLKQLIDEVGPAIIGHLLADLTPAQLRTRALELTNVVLRNLAQDLSGAQIARLVTDHGADVVRWAAGDQSGSAARELLTRLNAAAIGGLRDVSGREARQLLDQFGHQVLNAVSPTVPGSGLRDLVIHFGAESAKGIAEDRINGGKINDLITYVRNLRQASSTTGTGELVSPAPLDPHSVIVDSNYIRYLNYAQQKIASGQPLASLPPVERNVYNHYQSIAGGPTGTRDLRITNVTIAEAGPTPNVPARGGIPSINRNSQEYRDVLAALERRQLGGAGAEGAGDRAIVADAFFAGPPGYRATLVTTDRGIYNALADMAGHNPGKLGKSVPDALPNGFEVKFTVGTTQRSIWLRPISGK